MNARWFSQHPGLPSSVAGDLGSTTPSSCFPITNLPCHLPLCHHGSSVSQAPCALTPGFQPGWATFNSSTWSPQFFLPGRCPHFTPEVSSPSFPPLLPDQVSHSGAQVSSTPQVLIPQSFSLGCFSPPVYATSTNEAQDPFFSLFGVQEVDGTEHNSPWLYQEVPRRAQPETSCSVHAAIDWSTVSTDRNTKEFSCQTYKPLPCVCKLQFITAL